MDKVLLICKIFNYNIDELLNENVKEVDETKQSKININKYIDDFFEFLTKTVDMFSSMKFWQIVKCLIEQCIIAVILMTIFLVLGEIFSNILYGLFGTIFHSFYGTIHNILESIYLILALIIGITIILHIFKVRYLDYYEIVKEDNDVENEQDTQNENEIKDKSKILLENKKEKIIIRDANHSGSKFLTGLAKMIVFGIKLFVVCIAFGFCCSFVMFATLLVISFMFVKAGMVFWGSFFGIIAAMLINFAILEVLYNFIVSKKNNKTRIAIMLVTGLLIGGMSIGMILIGATKFNVVQAGNEKEDELEIPMTENLSIECWSGDIQYEVSEIENVKIVVKHPEYNKVLTEESSKGTYYIYFDKSDSDFMEQIRNTIDDINHKRVKDYVIPEVYVYASQQNIEKIQYNQQNKIQLEEEENDRWIEIQNEMDELQNQLEEKDILIESQKDELEQKDNEISNLREMLYNRDEF